MVQAMRGLVFVLLVTLFLHLSQAQFAKQRRPGEPMLLYTNGDHHWNHAYLTVQDRAHFVFAVKACASARIVLSTNIGASDMSVEIVLGDDQNFVSRIQYPFAAGKGIFETSTPHILHCEEFREFWVQWLGDYIEVGSGNTLGLNKFMNHWFTDPFAINTVGFSSGTGQAATWSLAENAGDMLEVVTPDAYMYDTFWRAVKNREMMNFQVRACGDVHVLLANELGQQHRDIVEFSIGGWSNTQSVIRTNVYGGEDSIKAVHMETGIVACAEYREFYVSWVNGTFTAAKGSIYPHGSFMSWQMPDYFDVNWLAITTGFGNTGTWTLNVDNEVTNLINTPQSNDTSPVAKYNSSWLEVPRQHSLVFDVKAPDTANLLLALDTSLAEEDLDIEIRIGTGENKDMICVGSVFQPVCITEVPFSMQLNENHYIPFWVSWVNHTLHMGAGWFIGQGTLIKDIAVTQLGFNAVSFATTKSWGMWRVRGYWGSAMQVHTPPAITHFYWHTTWRTMQNKDYVQFQFKGDSDCHVALARTTGVSYSERYYEVLIGGWDNSRSVIREAVGDQQYDEISEVNTQFRLDPNQYLDLWISWYHGFVEVGSGAIVGEQRFLSHSFESLPVRAVSFATWTSHYGHWRFPEDTGDHALFWTNGTNNWKGWSADHWFVLAPNITWTNFKVMACKDANIYISSLEQNSDKIDRYRIVIGEEDNTRMAIYHGSTLVSSIESVQLSCYNNRDFWISWEDGNIKVGRGIVYNHELLVEGSAGGSTYNISVLGFTAPAGVNARWMVHDRAAGDLEVYTTTEYTYKTWTTVDHRQYMFFALNACSDAHILLSERLNKQHGFSYEIVIGGWYNSRSVIREYIEDEHGQRTEEWVVRDTPGIHNCSVSRRFWVSWENNFLSVGVGANKDKGYYIEYHPITMRPIRAMAFSTGYGYDGFYTLNFLNAFPTPPVEEVPVTDPNPVIPKQDDSLSGGVIAGIVIGVVSLVVIIGAIVFLALTYRGTVSSPSFLQPPVEGSGFSNPSAASQPQFSETVTSDA